MPSSRATWMLSIRSNAVSVTILSARSAGSSRMCRTSEMPSMPGIRTSTMARSNGCPSSAAARSCASASSPPLAVATRNCHSIACSTSTLRSVSLSSAISTFSPASDRLAPVAAAPAPPAGSSRAVTVNTEPRPGADSTVSVPPIISASCREITSPSPVPPYLRAVELSACWNGLNSCADTSGAIPMPLSAIVNATRPCSGDETASSTCPRSVNLIALPTRFVRICRNRTGSPRTHSGTGSCLRNRSASALRRAVGSSSDTTSSSS